PAPEQPFDPFLTPGPGTPRPVAPATPKTPPPAANRPAASGATMQRPAAANTNPAAQGGPGSGPGKGPGSSTHATEAPVPAGSSTFSMSNPFLEAAPADGGGSAVPANAPLDAAPFTSPSGSPAGRPGSGSGRVKQSSPPKNTSHSVQASPASAVESSNQPMVAVVDPSTSHLDDNSDYLNAISDPTTPSSGNNPTTVQPAPSAVMPFPVAAAAGNRTMIAVAAVVVAAALGAAAFFLFINNKSEKRSPSAVAAKISDDPAKIAADKAAAEAHRLVVGQTKTARYSLIEEALQEVQDGQTIVLDPAGRESNDFYTGTIKVAADFKRGVSLLGESPEVTLVLTREAPLFSLDNAVNFSVGNLILKSADTAMPLVSAFGPGNNGVNFQKVRMLGQGQQSIVIAGNYTGAKPLVFEDVVFENWDANSNLVDFRHPATDFDEKGMARNSTGKSKNITFRRCHFKGKFNVALVFRQSVEDVTIEECVFDACSHHLYFETKECAAKSVKVIGCTFGEAKKPSMIFADGSDAAPSITIQAAAPKPTKSDPAKPAPAPGKSSAKPPKEW
ncbi:MAG: hypothetical protein ACRDD1_14400, partial [Planctomycetia bacterium]